MRKLFLYLLVLILSSSALYAAEVVSPNGNLKVIFNLTNEGTPSYSVSFRGKEVIRPSKMGFELKDTPDMLSGFTLTNTSNSTFDETWTPVWGETKEIRNHYNEMLVELKQQNEDRTMKIRFRVFDEGIGFRYEFDKQPNLSYFRIKDERTQFSLTGNHKIFWIPGDYDSNEYFYTTTRITDVDASTADGSSIGTHGYFAKNAIQTPTIMKTNDGLYIQIFEAALLDYSAMNLLIDKTNLVMTSSLVPDATGTKVYMQTPQNTPWRTIMVSDKATDILASQMIMNLNEPCKIKDTGFIKPQKFIGIWWGMHVPDHWTWNYADVPNIKLKDTDWYALKPNGRHGATTEHVKEYIDFAAKNGIQSVLVEGWNVGWEDWSGNWKEEVFDFVTPYPDFNVAELRDYAKSKGVKLIMHHETSGSVSNYERRIDNAIQFMKKNNYGAVKTGYVGWIIPRGEKHDGQWMVNHYQRVIEKTAANEIMLDQHEPVRPTGQSRTYPNLMACEAARGNEFNAWSVGNPPEHETILPFTRLKGGPMDYTPGIFEVKMDHYQKGNPHQVHTTLAKQLALYLTMYSPMQMAADLIENYEKRMDAFQFIKDVAVDWDDSKYLEAEPGDYITIARKAKGTSDWFVGAITDENARVAAINLSFLDPKTKYTATIYEDALDADWKENPMAYHIRTVQVTSKTILKQKLAPGGGAAISIRKTVK
ncbi:MAG: glycoside hydrolase family 97 protein [Paludibacteraceae bacterium]